MTKKVNINSHHHTCPWWLTFTFDNPLRNLIHRPAAILNDLVHDGDRVVDLGCGLGYFTLPLARLVGPTGRVIAVDLQANSLACLRRRAQRHDLLSRITLHQSQPDDLGLSDSTDFMLAFWMLHEVRQLTPFLHQVRMLLKPGARFLIVEPYIHVSADTFRRTVSAARAAGLEPISFPQIRFSRAALLQPAEKIL